MVSLNIVLDIARAWPVLGEGFVRLYLAGRLAISRAFAAMMPINKQRKFSSEFLSLGS